jgi:hypothetical protein
MLSYRETRKSIPNAVEHVEIGARKRTGSVTGKDEDADSSKETGVRVHDTEADRPGKKGKMKRLDQTRKHKNACATNYRTFIWHIWPFANANTPTTLGGRDVKINMSRG